MQLLPEPPRVSTVSDRSRPESSTSYELGFKSRFFDNKVQLNVIGFSTDYNNFQAQSAVIVNNAAQFVLNNVGKLKTKGVEVEFSAKPSDWLRLDASAAYTDANMTSFPGAQGYSDQTGQFSQRRIVVGRQLHHGGGSNSIGTAHDLRIPGSQWRDPAELAKIQIQRRRHGRSSVR